MADETMHTDFNASAIVLAQTDAAPSLAGTPAQPSTTSAAGSGTPTEPAAAPRGGVDFVTLMIFGVVLALIVSTLLGGRREKKKYEAMMAGIKKNDQIRTVGGIIGTVVEVKPDVIVLKVDENSNTKLTVARGKIEAVMKDA